MHMHPLLCRECLLYMIYQVQICHESLPHLMFWSEMKHSCRGCISACLLLPQSSMYAMAEFQSIVIYRSDIEKETIHRYVENDNYICNIRYRVASIVCNRVSTPIVLCFILISKSSLTFIIALHFMIPIWHIFRDCIKCIYATPMCV